MLPKNCPSTRAAVRIARGIALIVGACATVLLFLRPVVRLGVLVFAPDVNRLPTMPPVKPLPVTKPLLTMFVSPFVVIWVASMCQNTPPTPTLRQREFFFQSAQAAAAA